MPDTPKDPTEELLKQALARAEAEEARTAATDPEAAAAFAALRSEDPDASGPLIRRKAKYTELRDAEESERSEHAEITLGPNPVGKTTDGGASYRPRSRDAFVTEPSIQRKRALGLEGQVVETGRTIGGQTARIAIVPMSQPPADAGRARNARVGIVIAISMFAGALMLWVAFGRRPAGEPDPQLSSKTASHDSVQPIASARAIATGSAETAASGTATATPTATATATATATEVGSHTATTVATVGPIRSAPKSSATTTTSARPETSATSTATAQPTPSASSRDWVFYP